MAESSSHKEFQNLTFLIALFTITLFLAAPSANAGGFSSKSEEEIIRERKRNEIRFIWRLWSQPFWQRDNICREFKGNLVCLSPLQAKQYRWSEPQR